MNKIISAIVFSVTILAGNSSAEAAAQCEALLQYGSRESTVEASRFKLSSMYYNKHCEGNVAKESANTDVGFFSMIQGNMFDVDVSTGSSSEKVNNFCKLHSENQDKNVERYRGTETVNTLSLSSFVECVRLSKEGVAFSPKFSRTQFTLDIQRTSGAKLVLTGFDYDESLLNCSGLKSDNTRVPLKSVAPIELDDNQTWTVLCTRKPQSVGDTEVYPEAALSVATSQSSFVLPLPADAIIPRQWATELEAGLAQVKKEVQTIPRSFGLTCDKIELASPQAQYAQVTVPIPPDTFLTGGGCALSQSDYPGQGGHNPIVLQSRPESDGRGWFCRAGDPPGVPLFPVVTAYAIFCKVSAEKT